jgi:hypothetical protein
MDKGETATLLAMVSALDRQPVDDGMVEMWWRLLGGFSFAECEAAVLPVYRESRSGFVTAKGIYDRVRSQDFGPGRRVWVEQMHDLGEHFECRPGEFGCK